MGRGSAAWLLGLSIIAFASRAYAHPLVDDAERELDAAHFGAALSLFERAAGGDDLDVADVVRVLEGRALALRALGREADVEADLRRLAALRPRHAFSSRVPPEIAHRFQVLRERGAERLRARVEVTREGDRVRLALVVAGDPGGLVREATLFARAGEGPWQSSADGEVVLEVHAGDRVEYHARVIGLGGAPVVEHGAEDAPLPALVIDHVSLPPPVITPATPPLVPEQDDPWPWVLGASGIVAAAAIVITVVLVATASQSDDTRLSPPHPSVVP